MMGEKGETILLTSVCYFIKNSAFICNNGLRKMMQKFLEVFENSYLMRI